MKDFEKDIQEFMSRKKDGVPAQEQSLQEQPVDVPVQGTKNIDSDLQEFMQRRQSSSSLTYNPVDISQQEAATKRPYDNPNIISDLTIEPVMDILSEASRGALIASANTINKIQAAGQLVNDLTASETLDINGLKKIDARLRETASQIPETPNPLIAGVAQFAGSIPAAALEFAGAGGPAGMVGRSAVLGALGEYYKNPNVNSLIKGAGEGAVLGFAAEKAAPVLQATADLTARYGYAAGRQFLKVVTNMADDNLDYAMKNLEKFNLNVFKKVENAAKEVSDSNKQIKAFKDKAKQEIDAEETLLKDKLDTAVSNSNEKLKIFDLNNQNIMDSLKKRSKEEIDTFNVRSSERLAEATTETVQKSAQAKEALDNELFTLFQSQKEALQLAKNKRTEAVTSARNTLKEKGLDYAPQSVVRARLEEVIKRESKGLADIEKGYLKDKTNSLSRELGEVNSLIELVKSTAKTGKIDIAALKTQEDVIDSLIKTTVKNEVKGLLMGVREAINITKIHKANPSLSPHLKGLSEANEFFSSKIDPIRDSLNMFSREVDGVSTLNLDNVFKALNTPGAQSSKELLNKISKADSLLPDKLRVLPKVQKSFNQYKNITDKEAKILETIKKEVLDQKKNLVKKFDDIETRAARSIDLRKEALKDVQRINKEQIIKGNKDLIERLKADKEMELSRLQEVIDSRLQFFKTQESLRNFRPPANVLPRLIQNISSVGIFPAAVSGNVAGIATSVAGLAGTSPVVASNLIKAGKQIPKGMRKAASLAEKRLLKQLILSNANNQ